MSFNRVLACGCVLMGVSFGAASCSPTSASTTPDAEPAALPLSVPGPYAVGIHRGTEFVDASRGDRPVGITVWYPALPPVGPGRTSPTADAPPDRSGAPYPLILSSSKVGFIFGPHLASHGFVVVGVNRIDTYVPWDENLIDQPLDLLFALDQVASQPPELLAGILDPERAGAMGYSFDGYNALALSGARVDPAGYLERCAEVPLESHWVKFGYCAPAARWDEFADHAGEVITASADGLWQPMTDDRLKALMPMAADGAILFGEDGLAAIDRPILLVGGTADTDVDYRLEAAYIYEHSGAPETTLVSFIRQGHMMIYDPEMVSRMAHFATAFFGDHLQGREEWKAYYSQDFFSGYDDLAWGVIPAD